jgi:O-antigen/teichoic acid export membrane protein
MIKRALPLGAGSGLYSAAPQIDTMILHHLATRTAVGLFSAPLRLVQAPSMVPGYLAASLFPWLSKLAVESRSDFDAACERSFRFLAMLGVPAAAACFVCAPALVNGILSREYHDSIPGLRILALSIAPVFLTALLPYLFTAVHHQRLFLFVCLSSLLIRSGLNFMLTPHWGFLGACASLTVGEVLCFALGLVALHQGLKIRPAFVSILWKPLVAALLMGGALYPVRAAALPQLALGFLGAGLVYLGGLWALRALSADEVKAVLNALPYGRRLLPPPAPVAHE